MQLAEKNRKYILVGMVVFIILGVFTAKVLGSKQDKQFIYEDMLYSQANQMYQEGNYIDALSLSNDLLQFQPRSEAANNLGGLIAASTGEYKQAAILFQKTMDINPYKVDDALFMIQLGEILFYSERYEDAKKVLENCKERGWMPEEFPDYQQHVDELLAEINTKA